MKDIPNEKLLGDRVEEIAKKLFLDKVARGVERATKKPCKCQQRKTDLNELHKRLRKRLKNE